HECLANSVMKLQAESSDTDHETTVGLRPPCPAMALVFVGHVHGADGAASLFHRIQLLFGTATRTTWCRLLLAANIPSAGGRRLHWHRNDGDRWCSLLPETTVFVSLTGSIVRQSDLANC